MAKNEKTQAPVKKSAKTAVTKTPAKKTAPKAPAKTAAKTTPKAAAPEPKAKAAKPTPKVEKPTPKAAKVAPKSAKPTPKVEKTAPKVEPVAKVEKTTPVVPTQKTPANAHVIQAVRLLKQLTNGLYRLVDLSGETNYANRVQLLKTLRKTDKVLVKTSGINALVKEFYDAVGVGEGAAAVQAAEFERRAADLYRDASKAASSLRKADKERSETELTAALKTTVVVDDKPILPGYKPPSKSQRKAEEEATIREVVAKAAIADEFSEANPIAQPRPSAKVEFDLEHVCLRENSDNGIILLQLEKTNSQGAICVYNNGSRVAAGVVPTETLETLREQKCDDLIRDINQLLNPIVASVTVTPVAKDHLTALLTFCKENNTMPTEKTSKFAAPAKTAAKKTASKKVTEVEETKTAPAKAAKAEKTAPAKAEKTAKAAKPAKAESTGSRSKLDEGTKVTILTKDRNPYREGSKAYNSWELLKKAKTVGDFVTAVEGSKTDVYGAAYFIKWASEPHGNAPAHIKVG